MTNKAVFLATALLLASNAVAEGDFLCITDQVSGFFHDTNKDTWEQVNFLPGEKFMISELTQDTYRLSKSGEKNYWTAICTHRRDQTADSFTCRDKTNEVHFNRKELRFTAFRYFGFWNGSSDSLSIAIGSCFAT